MSSEKQQLPKPKRRWFQLRLRTLLVLVTLASILIGCVSWELDQRRREKVAIAWVEKMGGSVSFEAFISRGLETSWWKKTKDAWLGKRVAQVDLAPPFFNQSQEDVSDLSPLANGLQNLEALDLTYTGVSDLTPLAGMENLQRLHVGKTEVSDLSPLADMKNLEVLNFYSTPVNDLSPLADMKNLKYSRLDQTEVSDLSPLAGMESLEELRLEGTNVTEEQIDKLKLALPNCKIRHKGHWTFW